MSLSEKLISKLILCMNVYILYSFPYPFSPSFLSFFEPLFVCHVRSYILLSCIFDLASCLVRRTLFLKFLSMHSVTRVHIYKTKAFSSEFYKTKSRLDNIFYTSPIPIEPHSPFLEIFFHKKLAKRFLLCWVTVLSPIVPTPRLRRYSQSNSR